MSFEFPGSGSEPRARFVRKPLVILLVGSVFGVWPDSSTASAQGLFSRMRSRIEARRQLAPPVPGTGAPIPNLQDPAFRLPAVPSPSGRTPDSPRVLATPTPGETQSEAAPEVLREAEGLPETPSFGIDVTPARDGQFQGLRVIGFQPNSLAPSAGLQPGDLIVSIQGQRTRSLDDVPRFMANSNAAERAEIQIVRNGRRYRTTIPINVQSSAFGEADERSDRSNESIASADDRGAAPRSAAKPPVRPATEPTLARPRSSLGLEVRNAAPQRGIEVVVAPEGTAGVIGGFKPEDRIVSVDGRLVKDIDGLIRELSATQPGESVRFGVVRSESMLELDIKMGGPGGKPIRGATEPDFPATKTEKPEARTGNGGDSILGGMGAALGGLFAPKGPSSNSEASSNSGASANSPATKPNIALGKSATALDESEDPLALPEDEAALPEDEAALPEDEAAMRRNGSEDSLPAPQRQADSSMSEVERLRAEVKRLKRQLNHSND